MPATFQSGTDWQQSSEPHTIVDCQEQDCWPVDTRSIAGNKDQLDGGLHPVVAIGGMTAADGRPLNLTGVVVSVNRTVLGTGTDRVEVDIACGKVVRQFVCNILTYNGGNPATYETAPIVGQPVYVDDSDDLLAGTTLSMSPLNSAGLKNPQAGVLWYCQDEIADASVGGARATSTFLGTLANSNTEAEYCVLLVSKRDLA